MKLIIGNKNYSSWSMRPWLAAKVAGLVFEEEIIWLRHSDTSARIKSFSPHGRVPILVDGDVVIFESIAILEYLAELAPSLWPQDRAHRAHARSISAEMHAGFAALRSACPMNFRRSPRPVTMSEAVEADVARIAALIVDCRSRFGKDGPFLFGRTFTNADAMFAPVAHRLYAYDIPVPPEVRAYIAALMATPAWQEWQSAALAESEAIAETDQIP